MVQQQKCAKNAEKNLIFVIVNKMNETLTTFCNDVLKHDDRIADIEKEMALMNQKCNLRHKEQDMDQNRLKSWAVGTAVIAQVTAILILTNVIPVEQVEILKGVATAVLEMLVLFGILNNPNRSDGF